MPLDPTPHLDPRSTAVVNMECQEGLIGPNSALPGLAEGAARVNLVDNLAELFGTARGVGVRIYYCTDERRADGFGFAYNPLMDRMLPEGDTGGGGRGPVMAAITPQPEDVVFRREQGLTGFYATGLDAYLRNTGVRTIVLTGVSLNFSVVGTALEAANRGYTLVVPRDGVASDPPEYAETILKYTIRNLAYVVPTRTVVDIWNGYAKGEIVGS